MKKKTWQDQEPNSTQFSDDDNAPEAPPRFIQEILNHPSPLQDGSVRISALGEIGIGNNGDSASGAPGTQTLLVGDRPTYQQAEDVWLELVNTVAHLKGKSK